MSSPIHHAKDLDAALMYAPPWARNRPRPVMTTGAPVERPRSRRFGRGNETFSGDRAMQLLQRQLALNPGAIPEPPIEDARSLWPFALRLGAVAAFAAFAAWGIVLLSGTKQIGNETVQVVVPPTPEAPPLAAKRVNLVTVRSLGYAPPAAQEQITAGDAPTATQPETLSSVSPLLSSAASPPPSSAAPEPAASPQSAAPTIALDHDEIATLVKRGKEFLSNGDLASARLLLRRAAEAGNAEAALALGLSFDPRVMARLSAVGVQPDSAQARKWYQTAASLGSEAAAQQLAQLAQSSQ